MSVSKRVIVFLTSLCAEGTPILVLEMCRWWIQQGIQPIVVILKSEPQDLLGEFQQLSIPLGHCSLPPTGLRRYPELARVSYQLARQYQPDAVLSMPLGWHTFIAYGAKLAGVPTVAAHVGNYPPYWAGNAFQKFRLQMQLGRPVTDRLICCSHYIQKGVITHFGIAPRATVTIYNAIPASFSQGPAPSPPAPPRDGVSPSGRIPPIPLVTEDPQIGMNLEMLPSPPFGPPILGGDRTQSPPELGDLGGHQPFQDLSNDVGAQPPPPEEDRLAPVVDSPSSHKVDDSGEFPNPVVQAETQAPVTYSCDRPFTIGMVARLEQHKDQPTLIRAAKYLTDQGYPLQVLLIGEGSRRAEYETLIHQLDLHDHVHLLGMRRDIPALLQQMDAFAFSAKPDEGFGIALAEAMAAGVPIVATDVGACQEVLAGGRLGLLVPPGDPVALATGLLQILEQPTAAYQRAAQAQEQALQAFTIETMAQKYAQCLGLLP